MFKTSVFTLPTVIQGRLSSLLPSTVTASKRIFIPMALKTVTFLRFPLGSFPLPLLLSSPILLNRILKRKGLSIRSNKSLKLQKSLSNCQLCQENKIHHRRDDMPRSLNGDESQMKRDDDRVAKRQSGSHIKSRTAEHLSSSSKH